MRHAPGPRSSDNDGVASESRGPSRRSHRCVVHRAPPPPPTLGYGAPYRGTGEGVYVKDSRGDWDITEGHHKVRSEQALEASGDPEYEARRQIAKDYNVRLYREGMEHRARGHHMMEAGARGGGAGLIVRLVVAPKLQEEKITPATAACRRPAPTRRAPRERDGEPRVRSVRARRRGVTYGYSGGRRPPPYHVWKTPGPLDRPAYVRQQTEPYNEKIGAPSIPDEDGQQKLPGKPRPPPGDETTSGMPSMRGGRP